MLEIMRSAVTGGISIHCRTTLHERTVNNTPVLVTAILVSSRRIGRLLRESVYCSKLEYGLEHHLAIKAVSTEKP